MKIFLLITTMLLSTMTMAQGRLSNKDFASLSQLQAISTSATVANLLNDTKVYSTQYNKTIAQAIIDGNIGSGSGGAVSSTAFINFEASGPYVSGTHVSGARHMASATTVVDFSMTRRLGGSSGSTTVDIKYSTSGGAWTSIFSTRPVINATAAPDAYRSFGVGSASGTTSPVLSGTTIPANSLIRMDITTAEPGAFDLNGTLKLQ